MLQKTQGIVLRNVKYGDTSLITTIFTATFGIQAYMVQGVRSVKASRNRAGLLQPATLLDLVADQRPMRTLQRIREFQPFYIYTNLQEEVVKNSIALFSVELLLRLLPEHAAMPELFDFTTGYFIQLDKMPVASVANFPIFFIINTSRMLGFDLKGNYSDYTPYLNLQEGGYSELPPHTAPFASDEDARLIDELVSITAYEDLDKTAINAATRNRLLDWYIEFLHRHTQHLGNLKSLEVLRAILH